MNYTTCTPLETSESHLIDVAKYDQVEFSDLLLSLSTDIALIGVILNHAMEAPGADSDPDVKELCDLYSRFNRLRAIGMSIKSLGM